MEPTCPSCGGTMSEDDPGLDKTAIYFTIEYSCSCGATATISFEACNDIQFTDADGEDDIKSLLDFDLV